LPASNLLSGTEQTDDDSGSHSLRENKTNSKFINGNVVNYYFENFRKKSIVKFEISLIFKYYTIFLTNDYFLVIIRLSWDCQLANEQTSITPMYLAYKEYLKEAKDRDQTLLTYPFELLQTIVEAIKTVNHKKCVFYAYQKQI
jgi:hypothetical protein